MKKNHVMKKTHLLGHRGARGEAPENTWAGLHYTQQLPVDGIEFDVQLTQDGALAVFHDANLVRCCGQQGWIDQISASALSSTLQTSLNHHFKPLNYPPQYISMLSEVIPLLTGFRYIELEVKTHQRTDYTQLTAALLRMVNAEYAQCLTSVASSEATVGDSTSHDVVQQPVMRLTSFDITLHEQLQRHGFTLPRGLLVEAVESTQQLVALAKRLGCVGVALHHSVVTAHRVRALHAAGLSTTVWTVNDVSTYQCLLDWGVDAVITDYPSLLLSVSS